MEFVIRAFGLELSVVLGQQDKEPYDSASLSGHFDFGFAPDPVFPELVEWEDE